MWLRITRGGNGEWEGKECGGRRPDQRLHQQPPSVPHELLMIIISEIKAQTDIFIRDASIRDERKVTSKKRAETLERREERATRASA
jgi:hypothetical protein